MKNHSIKNLKPNYKSGYHQGYYQLVNQIKYKGTFPIIYRSLLERKFCTYLDLNINIDEWYSEPIKIKYINQLDNKQHVYYPDYIFKSNGNKVIVEVKSSNKLQKPKPPKKKTKKSIANYNRNYKEYVTNVSKILAAREYAHRNGYKFVLITEKELKKMI